MEEEERRKVDFDFRPWRRIIVHEVNFEPLPKILGYIAASTPMGGTAEPALRWCNGWLFFISGAPMGPEIERERMGQVMRWLSLGLCPLEKWIPLLEIPDGKIKVPIFDVSHIPLFRDMIEWVEKTFPKEVEEAKKVVQ